MEAKFKITRKQQAFINAKEDEVLYPFENVFVEAWEPNCSSYLDDYDDRFCVTYVLRPSGPDDRTPLVSELFGEEIYHQEFLDKLQAISLLPATLQPVNCFFVSVRIRLERSRYENL